MKVPQCSTFAFKTFNFYSFSNSVKLLKTVTKHIRYQLFAKNNDKAEKSETQ